MDAKRPRTNELRNQFIVSDLEMVVASPVSPRQVVSNLNLLKKGIQSTSMLLGGSIMRVFHFLEPL